RHQAPPGFLFAVKGSRYVSHIKRLAAEQKSIDLVVDSARALGDKLGPILFQLQANFHLDLRRLERFLGMLPDDLRFSLEFRHESWLAPAGRLAARATAGDIRRRDGRGSIVASGNTRSSA